MCLLSKKDVKTVVSRAIGSNVEILGHNLEPFSEVKAGIMGFHYQLNIKVKENSDVKKYTFFLKTYSGQSILGDLPLEKYSFEEEENFFARVRSLLLENYRGERWSAECYLVKPGILVFEDLRANGYSMSAEFSLSESSTKAVLIPLARFHACSLLAEAKLGKSLTEAFPSFFEEKYYNSKFKFNEHTKIDLEVTIKLAKKFGLDPSSLPKILDYICRIVRHSDGNVNVINHGDLWKNNLMFKNDEPSKCIIIDYQMLRHCSFACDLSYIIRFTMNPEFQKLWEMEMFKFYYTVFQETLQQSGIDVLIPSYEKMLKEYEDHRIFAQWLLCNFFPLAYFASEEVEKMMLCQEGIERWYYGDRFGLFESHLDSNSEVTAFLKVIVSDLLNEGKRLIEDVSAE